LNTDKYYSKIFRVLLRVVVARAERAERREQRVAGERGGKHAPNTTVEMAIVIVRIVVTDVASEAWLRSLIRLEQHRWPRRSEAVAGVKSKIGVAVRLDDFVPMAGSAFSAEEYKQPERTASGDVPSDRVH
jgi:hypothetical protein